MGDLVYRQAAIEAAECIVEHHAITPYKTMAAAMDHLKRILNGMPSAQPEQTKMIKEIRKWINSGNRGSADYFIVDKIEEIINKYE